MEERKEEKKEGRKGSNWSNFKSVLNITISMHTKLIYKEEDLYWGSDGEFFFLGLADQHFLKNIVIPEAYILYKMAVGSFLIPRCIRPKNLQLSRDV